MGRNLCLRCDQAGHYARNCPSNPDKKRKVEDNSMMVEEHYDLAAEDEQDDTVSTAVQDGRAATTSGSTCFIYFLENGYDVRELQIRQL